MSFASTRITFGRPTGRRDVRVESALPDDQSATLPLSANFARQSDLSLAPPPRDQAVDPLDVPGEQGTGGSACLDGRPAQDSAAYGGRQGVQLGAFEESGRVPYGLGGVAGPGV